MHSPSKLFQSSFFQKRNIRESHSLFGVVCHPKWKLSTGLQFLKLFVSWESSFFFLNFFKDYYYYYHFFFFFHFFTSYFHNFDYSVITETKHSQLVSLRLGSGLQLTSHFSAPAHFSFLWTKFHSLVKVLEKLDFFYSLCLIVMFLMLKYQNNIFNIVNFVIILLSQLISNQHNLIWTCTSISTLKY